MAVVLLWPDAAPVRTSEGNTFTAATVVLGDDDQGTALFAPSDRDASGMVPGQEIVRCVSVLLATDASAGDQEVVLHGGGGVETPGLGEELELTVERGSAHGTRTAESPCGETFTPDPGEPVFRGTLTAFLARHRSAATGAHTGTWGLSADGEEHVFRICVRLRDDAVSSGASVDAVRFTWQTVAS